MQDLKVTIIQANLAWEDKAANLDKFETIFSNLKDRPDLVILPEMFNTGFVTEPHRIAEPEGGPGMTWLSEQAQKNNFTITGSLVIQERGHYFNRLIWMRPDGTWSTYDKRHLFRFGNEHLQFRQGTERMITELNGWKILPLVCYDLRFPVWSKNRYLSGQYEYDLMVYVANWPGKRSYPFRQLLIARAIENQAYVAGVNRVGIDGKGTLHQGESAVLDFRGHHLIEIPPDVEDVETLTLSYEKLHQFREQFKVALDWDSFEIKV